METTLLTYDDLVWPLGVQDSIPAYRVGTGSYKRTHKVDPYPCSHTTSTKSKTSLLNVRRRSRLHGTKAAFYLLSHESIDRVSGTAFSDNLYKESGKEVLCPCGCGKKETIHPLATCVVLSGKRIPPIPAMTRYLVPHEYGHMVWYHVSRMLGYRETDDSKFYELYMKTRGVEDYQLDYAGGKWHKNPGEIIANDFRLVFTNHEREFWPHDIPYPEETPIVDWWKEIHKQAIRIEATT